MPPAPLPFDERASTVNVALAIWTGVMAGVIVGLGGFEEVDPWRNAYVRLAALGATTTLLVMAFNTRSARSARRYQLGVLLSLLAHTGLGVGLAMANLSMLQPLAVVDAPPVEEPEQLDLSDLVVIDRTEVAERADFERPLESGAAQREAELLEPEHDAPKTLDTMIQPTEAPAYEPPAPEAPRLNRPTPTIAQADVAPGERRRNAAPAASIAASAAEYESDLVPLVPSTSDPAPRAATLEAERSAPPLLVTPVAPTQTPAAAPAAPPVVAPRRE
ncbi:MAG: hypothetical protein KDA37_05510, partial [Planctomycetales bacterium]|nr:hypothetical protein [Planctomycetales bacterium]